MAGITGTLTPESFNNFEHSVSAAPQLVSVLGNAPQVKAIVTSREALRIFGEHEFTVPPLAVPQARGAENDFLLDHPVIQLFAQRAQVVDSNFRLTPQNQQAILEPDAIALDEILRQCKKKLGKAPYAAAYKEGQTLKLESTLMQLMAE